MKKQTIFILFLVLCAISASAAPIGKSKAQAVAASFFQKSSMKAKVKGATVVLSKEYASSKDAPAAFYAFSRGENVVFVSADDEMPAILGYSDRTDLDNLPPAMEYMLDYYARLTDAVRRGEIPAPKLYASPAAVEPLCKTIWDQKEPFCSLSPVMEGKKTPNGCVSTGVAQVMKYYEWPVQATDVIPGYISHTKSFNLPAINPHTYNWANMLNDYNGSYTPEQGQAVAELCYDVAIAAKMDFRPKGGSGSFLKIIGPAMHTYFGYSKDLYIDYPKYYTEEEWVEKLKNEIGQNRPVPFSASTEAVSTAAQGHCFVLDGYNAEGLFHVNWGWGGESNDYYLITSLNPPSQGIGGSEDDKPYIVDQQVLFNCIPDRTGTSVASEHYRLKYSRIEGAGGDYISIIGLENESFDDFHGDLVLQLIDKDGKVVDQQTVQSDFFVGSLSVSSNFGTSLKNFDFSRIADGEYHTELIAVSKATNNEFRAKMLERNSPIVVENGKLKGVFNSAILEGKILSCEYEGMGVIGVIVKAKAQVKNIDDIPFPSTESITINAVLYDPFGKYPESVDNYNYTGEIAPGKTVELESSMELFLVEDDIPLDQQMLKLKLEYPNGTIDTKEYPMKDLMATAINDMKADKEQSNAPAYNTMGQRVNAKTAKGIIIQNGKKLAK